MTTTPLSRDAALLLRRIIVEPRSELKSVHTATDRMTELVDELRAQNLVQMHGGAWHVYPLGITDRWRADAATAKARTLLTVKGTKDADTEAWLTALGVPLTLAYERPDDWQRQIFGIPQRHFRVQDILRTTPEASMRGEWTPADEVLHWLTAMTDAKVIVKDKDIYTFPEPTEDAINAALASAREDRHVPDRLRTELVMLGMAVRREDGTVAPVETEAKSGVPTTSTASEPSLADRIVGVIEQHGKADAADITERVGVEYHEVQRTLTDLAEEGRIHRSGPVDWRPGASPEAPSKTAGTKPAPAATSTAPSTPTKTVAKTATVAPANPAPDYSRQVAEDIHAMRVRADEEAARRDEEERERQELLAMDVLTRRYLKKLIVLLACDGGKARQLTRNQMRRNYISSSMAAALNRVIALAVERGAVTDKGRHGVILLTHVPVMSDAEFGIACAERKAARDAEENAA